MRPDSDASRIVLRVLQAKVSTLRKYAETFELTVRPEIPNGELAIAVARCVLRGPKCGRPRSRQWRN